MVVVTSLGEVRQALLDHPQVALVGTGSGQVFGSNPGATQLQVKLQGIVTHDADDQVVTALGGTSIKELQSELKKRGQCLPWCPPQANSIENTQGTLAGQLSLNLPHGYESNCGTWRDWVLGLRLMLADGTTAKTGSKAVKNVAGYDVQRLLIGAKGALAVITEVTLRTFPIKALRSLDFEGSPKFPSAGFIHRVLPADFQKARTASDVLASHPGTATLYRTQNATRFDHDWIRAWGHPLELEKTEVQSRYEARAKTLFDPKGKFL